MKKFSTSHSSPLTPNEPGTPKRSVPGPTSPLHFLDLLLFSTLRRPIFVDPAIKAGVYLCLAAGVSLIFDFIRFFVKLGWAWTCGCLAAFVIVSSFVYTGGNVRLMRAHILRLAVGSGCWYSVTLPSGLRPNQRMPCQRAGGIWLGFDISGHCFLLVLSNLWIMEELSCIATRHIPEQQLDIMRSAYRRLTTIVRLIFSFTACLSMLWDIMFLSTVIYFHTMPSKLLGTALAVACWFLFYRVIFCSCERQSVGIRNKMFR
ncbi:unnamed protein product [Trichobilharzia regenti]|nr:unnamed protein product [Trichobilharzia regenti]